MAAAALSTVRIALPACRLQSFIRAGFVGTMMQLRRPFHFVPVLQGAMLYLYLGSRHLFQKALSNAANQGMVAQTLLPVQQHAGLQQVLSGIAEGPQCMMVLRKEEGNLCKVNSPIIIVAV